MKRVLTLAILIFSFASLGGRFDARTKKFICNELDDHIPALMKELDKEQATIDPSTCSEIKSTFKYHKGGEPGFEFRNFNCKKNYGKIREVYNKLVARKALADEVRSNFLTAKAAQKALNFNPFNSKDPIWSEYNKSKRAVARLEYLHQTFFDTKKLDTILQSPTPPTIQQIRREIKCGKISDCKTYLDDDFLEKFLSVLRIGYSCKKQNGLCEEDARNEIKLLDKRIIEFFQAKGLMDKKIENQVITSTGRKFNSALRKGDEFSEKFSGKLCDAINIEIIQQNSGRSLNDFRDQLYSPSTKIDTLQQTYEKMFDCKITPSKKDDKQQCNYAWGLSNIDVQIKALKEVLDTPPENVKVLRDFLSASLQAQHTLCDANDNDPFRGITADCGGAPEKLKLFITQNQDAVHFIDSFASFDQNENNQQLVYDSLMSFCPKIKSTKANRICTIKDEVAKKVYQGTPGGQESQKQHEIYQAGCSGHPSCKVVRTWNEETLGYDYSIKRGYGMQPMGGGWAGQTALGVAQGLSGYGSYSYFGAPTNHFAGALMQWGWSNNFDNYFGNYKDAMMPYWQQQTTYNSYLSQYYEAMSLNAMGIPQQLNWEALYPAYSGDSFSGISSMHAF